MKGQRIQCQCPVAFVASRREVVTLLKTVFSTLTVAMRYEPANARLFANEVRLGYGLSPSLPVYHDLYLGFVKSRGILQWMTQLDKFNLVISYH